MTKRILKSSETKSKSKLQTNEDGPRQIEAELKFDQEVLFSLSQLEKILSSDKLSEQKKQETMKAIKTLRKPNVSKIQKIQLMRTFFKDLRLKISVDEESVMNEFKHPNFVTSSENSSKGFFVKKKQKPLEGPTPAFCFDFKDPNEEVTFELNSIKLT